MLHQFISTNRDDIIRRCRVKVALRPVPPPTRAEIDHGVPLFLDQLVGALRRGASSSVEIADGAALHGHDLLRQGFTLSQVVHDYGDVCQSITELAVETSAPISTADFRVLNGCLDDAIANAVTQYSAERTQSTADIGASHEHERLGFLAHELRNLLQTAIMAFEVVKSGNVGIAGTTGTVLHRSLLAARDLLISSLTTIKTEAIRRRELLSMSGFIEEIAAAGMLGARSAGVTLTVAPVDAAIEVEVDRQVLAAVVMNLLQNAFKFTHPRTEVVLRVRASAARVLIEVQDHCGGLPGGDETDLFRAFEQRSANRTGVGLGLAFSRTAVEANHGRIYARNLAGLGCVFTIDLPRLTREVARAI